MALLVFAFGALFGALFALNNLIRTLTRVEKIGFRDLLLAYLTALTLLTALIVNNLEASPDPYVDWVTLLACGALAGFSIFLMLLEVFRPQRLKGSRGILGLFSALLIVLASLIIPFIAAYFSLTETDDEGISVVQAATPTDTILSEDEAQALQLFQAIRVVIAEEIDVPEAEVFAQLDAGEPLAKIVEENGGDVEKVIRDLTAVFRQSLAEAVERGDVNRLQAALFSSQMGNFVRIAVNSDLNTLGQRFGAPTPAPDAELTATRASLVDLLTELPPLDSTATPTREATATATPIDTRTPTETRTPTATRTARATPTPFPTITPFPSRTPIPTATLPAPCIASVNFNLRLRAEPSRDAATILTIPYASTIELYGRTSDSVWWLTIYEGEQGWVDGQYLLLSAACNNLPAR